MQNRLLDDLQRRTLVDLEGGCLPMPSRQFWYESTVRTLWWDLDLLYETELKFKRTGSSKSKWLGKVKKIIEVDMPAGGGLPHFIRENPNAEVRIVG